MGDAVNFDGAYSDQVRDFFIDNALYWIDEFHMDALRLDAIDTDLRFQRPTISCSSWPRRCTGTGKDWGENLPHRGKRPERRPADHTRRRSGGYGIDAQWNDNFHHALHTLLTGENSRLLRGFRPVRPPGQGLHRELRLHRASIPPTARRRHGSPVEGPAHLAVRGLFPEPRPGGQPECGDRLSADSSPGKAHCWRRAW